jgi:hypothetical protein
VTLLTENEAKADNTPEFVKFLTIEDCPPNFQAILELEVARKYQAEVWNQLIYDAEKVVSKPLSHIFPS